MLGAFALPSCNPLTLYQLQSPVTTAQQSQLTLTVSIIACHNTPAEMMRSRLPAPQAEQHLQPGSHQCYCLSPRLRETYVSWEMNIDMKGYSTSCNEERAWRLSLRRLPFFATGTSSKSESE